MCQVMYFESKCRKRVEPLNPGVVDAPSSGAKSDDLGAAIRGGSRLAPITISWMPATVAGGHQLVASNSDLTRPCTKGYGICPLRRELHKFCSAEVDIRHPGDLDTA